MIVFFGYNKKGIASIQEGMISYISNRTHYSRKGIVKQGLLVGHVEDQDGSWETNDPGHVTDREGLPWSNDPWEIHRLYNKDNFP